MSLKTNKFEGTFDIDSQVKSIPIQLLTVVSMLIDGPYISSRVSQPSLTVSQLIFSSFKQNNKCDNPALNPRENRDHETPVKIYTGLKLYATIRSSTIIDWLFSIGITISYVRLLDITKMLSDAVINQYSINGVFTPKPIKRSLFTIIAKDNNDKKC